MIELLTTLGTIVGVLLGLIQFRQKQRAKEREQDLQIRLAEVNARSAAEVSNDDLQRQHLETQRLLLTAFTEGLRESLTQLVTAVREGQDEVLKAFKTEMSYARGEMAIANKASKDSLLGLRSDVQTLPEATRRILNENFKQLPELTNAIISPQFMQVQHVILSAIDTMQSRIIERIDPQADAARMAIKTEMALIKNDCNKVFSRLEDIEHVIKQLTPVTSDNHTEEMVNNGTQ